MTAQPETLRPQGRPSVSETTTEAATSAPAIESDLPHAVETRLLRDRVETENSLPQPDPQCPSATAARTTTFEPRLQVRLAAAIRRLLSHPQQDHPEHLRKHRPSHVVTTIQSSAPLLGHEVEAAAASDLTLAVTFLAHHHAAAPGLVDPEAEVFTAAAAAHPLAHAAPVEAASPLRLRSAARATLRRLRIPVPCASATTCPTYQRKYLVDRRRPTRMRGVS